MSSEGNGHTPPQPSIQLQPGAVVMVIQWVPGAGMTVQCPDNIDDVNKLGMLAMATSLLTEQRLSRGNSRILQPGIAPFALKKPLA
jgi:hypothetical protein